MLAIVLLALGSRPGQVAPIASAWQQSVLLPNTPYDTQGFTRAANALADEAGTWVLAPLPHTIALAPLVHNPVTQPLALTKFRFTHTVSAQDDGQALGLYGTRLAGGGYSVRVNDQLLAVNTHDWRMQFNSPMLIRLPLALSKIGQTMTVTIGLPHLPQQGFVMGSVYLGPYADVATMHAIRNFAQLTAPMICTGVMLLIGAFALHLWWHMRDTINLLMAASAWVFAVSNLQFFYAPNFSADLAAWYGSLVDSAITWMLALIFLFAMRFQTRRHPIFERLLVVFSLAMTAVTLPVWAWHANGLVLQHVFNLLLFGAMALWFLRLALGPASIEFRVITVSIWVLLLAGSHDTYYMTGQASADGIHLFPVGSLAVTMAFLFATQRQHIQAVDLARHSAQVLRLTLAEREAELSKAQLLQLAAQESATLLRERQRLVRDMHDGLGSSLISTLAMVERGAAGPADVSQVLRECIDDLRVVIESLEPVDFDLLVLLGTLRQRLASRFAQAQVAFLWDVDASVNLAWMNAPQALQILRIVQEGLTNVLKHAQATQVTLSVKHQSVDARLVAEVSLQDNGSGLGEPSELGRGLRNMQARAAELRAQLHIDSSPQGTCLRLQLPIERPT